MLITAATATLHNVVIPNEVRDLRLSSAPSQKHHQSREAPGSGNTFRSQDPSHLKGSFSNINAGTPMRRSHRCEFCRPAFRWEPPASAGRSRTLQAAEKSINAVIPSEARDPSWCNCSQKEGFLVAALLGMTAIVTFSAASLVQRKKAPLL